MNLETIINDLKKLQELITKEEGDQTKRTAATYTLIDVLAIVPNFKESLKNFNFDANTGYEEIYEVLKNFGTEHTKPLIEFVAENEDLIQIVEEMYRLNLMDKENSPQIFAMVCKTDENRSLKVLDVVNKLQVKESLKQEDIHFLSRLENKRLDILLKSGDPVKIFEHDKNTGRFFRSGSSVAASSNQSAQKIPDVGECNAPNQRF